MEPDNDRALAVYMAKINENAERFDDMVENMKKVAMTNTELSVEERNLLSVAYKNVVGTRRAAWRIVSSIEGKEATRGHQTYIAQVQAYRKQIEKELIDICNEIIQVLDENLIPSAVSGEAKVFFFKMKGDYHRYLAEVTVGDERSQCAEKALVAYQRATSIAVVDLLPTHPIRLGLALNFSVFYYEILNSCDRACLLAKAAFDDAIQELDQLTEDSYKDSTLILQLLRDNLTLWSSNQSEARVEE